VSLAHLVAVSRLELPASTKAVLTWLAFHACENCGLCWPGMKLLCLETGLGETAIRKGIDGLERAGQVRIHGYATGGRGRATEYVVLPGLPEFSTAPCGKCRQNLRNPSRSVGFDNGVTDKPLASRGVLDKPLVSGAENPSRGEPQSSEEQNHHARAREAEPPPAGPAPVSNPAPTDLATAQKAIQTIIAGIADHTSAKP